VTLDVAPPPLGRLVIEGVLIINSTDVAQSLSATYIEIKGGSLIIATVDAIGQVRRGRRRIDESSGAQKQVR